MGFDLPPDVTPEDRDAALDSLGDINAKTVLAFPDGYKANVLDGKDVAMGRLIEEVSLRNKLHVFEDRTEAGGLIARKLVQYRDSGGIVLGIPSGGVPVAREIAVALHFPMDLMIVRKLQIPYNPEAGFGAMGPGGEIILNEGLLAQLGLTEDEIREQAEKTKEVIKRPECEARDFFCGGRCVQELVRPFGRGGSFYLGEDLLVPGSKYHCMLPA